MTILWAFSALPCEQHHKSLLLLLRFYLHLFRCSLTKLFRAKKRSGNDSKRPWDKRLPLFAVWKHSTLCVFLGVFSYLLTLSNDLGTCWGAESLVLSFILTQGLSVSSPFFSFLPINTFHVFSVLGNCSLLTMLPVQLEVIKLVSLIQAIYKFLLLSMG